MQRTSVYGPIRAYAPRVLPPLALLIADVGCPTAAQLGAFLDVHPRTVRRWIAADKAPRAVALALYWLTRWGRSAVDAAAANDLQLAQALLRSESEKAARLAAALDALTAGGGVSPATAQVISFPGRCARA